MILYNKCMTIKQGAQSWNCCRNLEDCQREKIRVIRLYMVYGSSNLLKEKFGEENGAEDGILEQ